MSSRKNKSKGPKKSGTDNKGDTSPAPEAVDSSTPQFTSRTQQDDAPATARTDVDDAPVEAEAPIEDRTEAVSGTPSQDPQDVEAADGEPREFTDQADNETKALYDDVVATPKDQETVTPQTGDMEDATALPVANSAAPLIEEGEGESGNFFRSFFACCIGRK